MKGGNAEKVNGKGGKEEKGEKEEEEGEKKGGEAAGKRCRREYGNRRRDGEAHKA